MNEIHEPGENYSTRIHACWHGGGPRDAYERDNHLWAKRSGFPMRS